MPILMRSQKEMRNAVHENQRKSNPCYKNNNPCYKVSKNLTQLHSCSGVLQKVEFVSKEIHYLVEGISTPSVEGMTCLLLIAYSKM